MKKQEMAEYVSKQYRRSSMDELYKAYGKCSYAKQQAWENCKRLCHEYGGWGLKVIGKNCHFFSAGFLFTDEETGVVRIMKITAYGHEAYDYI